MAHSGHWADRPNMLEIVEQLIDYDDDSMDCLRTLAEVKMVIDEPHRQELIAWIEQEIRALMEEAHGTPDVLDGLPDLSALLYRVHQAELMTGACWR